MKCSDPQLCYRNSRGIRIFRNWSMASDIEKYVYKHDFVSDCRKCVHCRKKAGYSLAARCVLHASCYLRNCFLTLTHDESRPGYNNIFYYKEIQDFKKRLRNLFRVRVYDVKTRKPRYHYWKRIEVFNVHEYGKRGKKHWHLIVFNHDFEDKVLYTVKNGIPLYKSDILEEVWGHGFCTVGDVSEASAMYQAQYMEKDFRNGHAGSAKASDSQHSGIGRPYFFRNYRQILMLGYVPFDGKKLPVPRYFEKLAHKHWAHFHDQSFFRDIHGRDRVYRPFKEGEANFEISELFIDYQLRKKERVAVLEEEWSRYITDLDVNRGTPDFVLSGSNTLHDLQNKVSREIF